MNRTPASEAASLRAATPADAAAVSALLAPYAAKGIVLPRSEEDIRACIDNFIVALAEDTLVGAIALRDFGNGLQEIRSLVVQFACSRAGIGSGLIEAALTLARARGVRRVFVLTLRPNLFERLGFHLVDRNRFPQKVWSDCARCIKLDCCDEVALQLELGDPALTTL